MYYSGIEPCDALNGEGFRTVIWVSGCSLNCKGCFNPKTHNRFFGQEYTEATENYILNCLNKSYVDGITISGGHPLESYNLEAVKNLILRIRKELPQKTIWLYTGYVIDSLNKNSKEWEVIQLCDVIVDGPYVEEQRDITLKWRGSKNQRILYKGKDF